MTYELLLDPTNLKILPANEFNEIIQNVLMILTTVKGTVPLDREFGISVNVLDAPINAQSRLTAEVADAIRQFEPRARLKKINFNGQMLDGKLTPTVIIDINHRLLRNHL